MSSPAPRDLRLALALDAGLSLPGEGPLVVLFPGGGERFGTLPAERVVVVSPHVAVLAAFDRQGLKAMPQAPARAAAVLVCLPRSREEARDALATAAGITDGPVIVDGQKDDGVDAMLRTLRPRVALSEPIAKGHGKIAWFPSPGAAAFADWRAGPGLVSGPDGQRFHTVPGVFSADGIDPGSALLAAALPPGLTGTGADLGAGWGYLAASLLARAPGIDALHLVEADARALDCARRNVTDPRAHFHWRDATRPWPGPALDFVVTNPPFHTGRIADPGLGAAFIATAAGSLKPSGRLWLVANRHLPYEAALKARFRSVEDITGGDSRYKLFLAQGPRRNTAPPGRPRQRSTSKEHHR